MSRMSFSHLNSWNVSFAVTVGKTGISESILGIVPDGLLKAIFVVWLTQNLQLKCSYLDSVYIICLLKGMGLQLQKQYRHDNYYRTINEGGIYYWVYLQCNFVNPNADNLETSAFGHLFTRTFFKC